MRRLVSLAVVTTALAGSLALGSPAQAAPVVSHGTQAGTVLADPGDGRGRVRDRERRRVRDRDRDFRFRDFRFRDRFPVVVPFYAPFPCEVFLYSGDLGRYYLCLGYGY